MSGQLQKVINYNIAEEVARVIASDSGTSASYLLAS
jgi:hypothetical protein